MPKRDDTDLMSLSFRFWHLGFDAATVMGLRTMRIMAGGALGRRESARMMNEKMTAATDLGWAFARAAVPTPSAAADTALDVYGPRVRRNKRRLTRR